MLNECLMFSICVMLNKRNISSEQGRHQLESTDSLLSDGKEAGNKEKASHGLVTKRLKWFTVTL